MLQSASPAIVTGDRHPRTLISINNLGMLLKAQGKLDEAGVLYNGAVPRGARGEPCDARRSASEHPVTSMNNLGSLLHDQGRKHRRPGT